MATSDNEHTTTSNLTQKVIIAIMVLAVVLGFWYLATQKKSDSNKAADSSKQEAKSDDKKTDAAAALTDQQKADKARAAAAAGQAVSTVETKTDDTYSYVVGDGESITTLARRAITSVDSKLSKAERVAAETKLAQDAGSAELVAGQDYKLTTKTVKAAIEWAKGLSAADKAAWQPWADMIAW